MAVANDHPVGVTAAVESGVLTSRMEALTDGLVDLLHRLCSQSSNTPPY